MILVLNVVVGGRLSSIELWCIARYARYKRAREAAVEEEKKRIEEEKRRLFFAMVGPTPSTHAILTQLKAGDTVHQAGELPKAH